uniref:Uncharacterized protein n=1 Tax=Wuchereria bancrofti TaxID=6293 RepID=A0AAF5PIZ2_WUCBA
MQWYVWFKKKKKENDWALEV